MPRLEGELAALRDALAAERDMRTCAQQTAAVAEARMMQMEAWLSETRRRLADLDAAARKQ